MLTNEIVLTVFADYLSRDADFEVILTSRGYTVMGWDKYREDWNTVEYCPTLLDAYTSFREMELTDGERDLTAAEKAKVKAECDALTEQCEKEAAICSS